ncbi:papain family cysteine protease domain-containing protein [Ditylenchus destructor]|nr:papain family cysteine protease domain-containing protein [Ditylenchus destructor]
MIDNEISRSKNRNDDFEKSELLSENKKSSPKSGSESSARRSKFHRNLLFLVFAITGFLGIADVMRRSFSEDAHEPDIDNANEDAYFRDEYEMDAFIKYQRYFGKRYSQNTIQYAQRHFLENLRKLKSQPFGPNGLPLGINATSDGKIQAKLVDLEPLVSADCLESEMTHAVNVSKFPDRRSVVFSPGEFLECRTAAEKRAHNCDTGGYAHEALKYAMKKGDASGNEICTLSDYPYVDRKKTGTCRSKDCGRKVKSRVGPNSIIPISCYWNTVQDALVRYGPLIANMRFDLAELEDYHPDRAEAYDGACSKTFNHAVTIFGWDVLRNPISKKKELCVVVRNNWNEWGYEIPSHRAERGTGGLVCLSLQNDKNKCGIFSHVFALKLTPLPAPSPSPSH